jgi:MFS family permease
MEQAPLPSFPMAEVILARLLADRLERRAVIAGVAALAAGLGLWLTLAPELPDAVLLTVAALISGLVLSVYSLGVSHVNDRLETSEMVAASSALLLLNGAAAVIGPIVGGVLMDRQGAPAYFATLAAIAALLAVFCLWRRSRRAPDAFSVKTRSHPAAFSASSCRTGFWSWVETRAYPISMGTSQKSSQHGRFEIPVSRDSFERSEGPPGLFSSMTLRVSRKGRFLRIKLARCTAVV